MFISGPFTIYQSGSTEKFSFLINSGKYDFTIRLKHMQILLNKIGITDTASKKSKYLNLCIGVL